MQTIDELQLRCLKQKSCKDAVDSHLSQRPGSLTDGSTRARTQDRSDDTRVSVMTLGVLCICGDVKNGNIVGLVLVEYEGAS